MALTRRQWEVLQFVAGFLSDHGYSPSYEEICAGMNVSSLATVHKHIGTLQKKGFLQRSRYQSRSIDLGPRYHAENRKRTRRARTAAAQSRTGTLPMMGCIAAGRPLEAIEHPETISLDDFAGKKEVFVLQVSGDSMIEDHILDGDYILVERTETANDNDVVVALVNGSEATLKRFYREPGGSIRLQPANASMQPIVLPSESVQIQGRLVGVLRKF
jgi:repressor LexA